MPISHTWSFADGGEVACWKLDESPDYFSEQLDLSHVEKAQLDRVHPSRKLEWLASRHLINQMIGGERTAFKKDSFGKPFLDHSHLEISVSHSRDYVAGAKALFKCGVDIQKFNPKIKRLAKKFLSDRELNSFTEEDELIALHVYWGAKESMYKAYGRKKLTFKRDMYLQPFECSQNKGRTIGVVQFDKHIETYEIHWTIIDEEYMLVYAHQLL